MRFVKEKSTHAEVVCNRLKKQTALSHEMTNFETHQTVGFGTHLTVDGDARLITYPA